MTAKLAKYGDAWTYSIGVNDLYFDFAAPSLVSAGIDPAEGYPRQIAAGDGSVPAFQRIREKQYQSRPSPSRCTCMAGRRSTN